jgi:CheY-specific phosphatase CheX
VGEEVKEERMSENTSSLDLTALANQFTEFGIYPHDGFLVIRIFSNLNERSAAALTTATETLLGQTPQHIVFDCYGMNDLPPLWARFVVGCGRGLVKSQRKIVGLNAGDAFKKNLAFQGLDKTLPIAANMSEALAKVGAARVTQALDVKLINPFLGAAAHAIQAQMGISCQTGSVSNLPPNSGLTGDISGVIALDCGSLRAVVVFSFPKDTIFKMVAKITGTPPVEVTSMVRGSVGEVTNVAFTRGKKTLNEMGYGIKSAVPKVVETHELPPEYWQYSGPGVKIPFNTDCGAYYAEIRLAA